MSFNKTILMGNLTRDPEIRSLPSGATVTNFGLAVNETWTDKASGEKREEVCFVDVDACSKRSKHSITLDRFSFVGSRNDSNGASSEDLDEVPF